MEHLHKVLHELTPSMLMVLYQISYAGLVILCKLASNAGMNPMILNAYRFMVSDVALIPLALIFERKSRPKITRKVLFLAFLAALIGGAMAQSLLLESLALTSTALVTAITNLIPAITFLLAIPFRMEKLEIGTKAGKAKVCGTLIGVAGAMLLTIYKGVEFELWSTHLDLLHQSHEPQLSPVPPPQTHLRKNQILGSFTAFAFCICTSLWLLIQTKLLKEYPRPYTTTALTTAMATVPCIIIALCTQRNWSQWKLDLDVSLLTVAYLGIINTALAMPLLASVSKMRGPVFASIFNPLSLVIVAILGSLILGEKLSLGSVLGAILIAVGLYMVLWGKSKTRKEEPQVPLDDSVANSPC